MRFPRRLAPILALLAVPVLPAAAQQPPATAFVRVRSAASGTPLADASVSLDQHHFLGVTDKEGALRVDGIAPGVHRIRVQFIGFETQDRLVDLRPGEVTAVTFQLESHPIEIAPLTVVTYRGVQAVHMVEFDQRRSRGNGYFITREDIDRTRPTVFSDLLRLVPGMRLDCAAFREDCHAGMRSAPGSGTLTYREGGIRGPLETDGCPIQYYVDGHYEPHPNVNDFNPKDVAGVEVYVHGSQAPARYSIRKNARCGVVLIWLRQSLGGS